MLSGAVQCVFGSAKKNSIKKDVHLATRVLNIFFFIKTTVRRPFLHIANRPLNEQKIYELKIKDLDVFEREEKK